MRAQRALCSVQTALQVNAYKEQVIWRPLHVQNTKGKNAGTFALIDEL